MKPSKKQIEAITKEIEYAHAKAEALIDLLDHKAADTLLEVAMGMTLTLSYLNGDPDAFAAIHVHDDRLPSEPPST